MNCVVYSGIVLLLALVAPSSLAKEDEVWCDLHDGGKLRNGEKTTDDPCSPCFCHGGQLQCAAVMCAMPPCVDARREPDHCCPSCPNGPNCRLPTGGVVQSGRSVRLTNGQKCRCPRRVIGYTDAKCRRRTN
ncbi:Brorin [Bulinus truncatus]|nr:Brorin [Bulinus truncatus]